MQLPPELIDKIAIYADIEGVQYLMAYLSKRTISHIYKRYKSQINTWIYEGKTEYLKVVMEHLELDTERIYVNHIPINVIELLADKITWPILIYNQKFSMKFLKKYLNQIIENECNIENYQSLTEEFIIENEDIIVFEELIFDKEPSDSFIARYGHKIDWNLLSMTSKDLSQDFIIKYADKLCIEKLLYNNNKVPVELIEKYINSLPPDYKSFYLGDQPLPENFIYKYDRKPLEFNGEDRIINVGNLSEEFLLEYVNIIGWLNLSKCMNLPYYFIEKYKDKLIWWNIFLYQNLTDEFIEKYKYKIYEHEAENIHSLFWKWILAKPTISDEYRIKMFDKSNHNYGYMTISKNAPEYYLIKYEDRLDWYHIYIYNKLSENLIEQHIDRNFIFKNSVNPYDTDDCAAYHNFWTLISKYQTVSELFIEKYKTRLDWYYIERCQTHLSKKFLNQYRKEFYLDL